MGTSSSSRGPGSGVPLVPPWVPPVPPALDDGSDDGARDGDQEQPEPAEPTAPAQPSPPAPTARFGAARTSLGRFARAGARADMRRGLGHYVRTGYGGAGTATRRMGGTVRTAGRLYGTLSSAAAGQSTEPGDPFDRSALEGRPSDEIMDALVEAVRPVDGTQDAEAERVAIRDALSDLLGRFPEANLLLLSEEQSVFAIERYVARDIYNRFRLDVGRILHDKAPSASAALSRLRDVRDYIHESVSLWFRAAMTAGEPLNVRRISDLVHQALQQTFEVFEAYVT